MKDLTLVTVAVLLFFGQALVARASCGNIIFPADIFYEGSEVEINEIEDCENPFSVTESGYPHTASIEEVIISENAVIPIPANGTTNYNVVPPHNAFGFSSEYYIHTDGGYELAAVSDSEQMVPLLPGTYTLVSTEMRAFLLEESSMKQRLANFLIPTAHAFVPNPRHSITFTLVATDEESGVSSILFLPGIKASHLYTKNLVGFEDELWIPDNNGDVRQLEMTVVGESVNDVYTRKIIGSATGLGSVYSGISGYFDTLVAQENIAAWAPFAYDWRYSVDDIVTKGTLYETERKYVLELIQTMAEGSDTGKVSLVGHSNGGLLAKVIVSELEKLGKENLIDQVVLLASPQTGTPEAIGSLLHGYGQAILGGLILRAGTAREVTQNLPGAYGLLPTKEYFADTHRTPVVVFEDNASTQAFIDAYGSQITDVDTLHDFIAARSDGRGTPESVYEPLIANETILEKTADLHTNVLQAWRAPASVTVTEVAGIGLPTVHSFAYRGYMKRDCTSLIHIHCQLKLHYKPVPRVSLLGDETVMTTSAVGYRGEKESYYFDLNTYKDNFTLRRHYNFTEAEPVHNLLSNILLSATNTTPFISKVAASVATPYVMMSVHSPVLATVTDSAGRQIKVEPAGDFMKKIEDIPGAYVYYFGETTYIVLPKAEEYQVELAGTGEGMVTLEIDEVVEEGGTQTTLQSIVIDTISTSTVMTTVLNQSTLSDVLVDVDGDGEVDKQIDAQTNEVTELNTPENEEEAESAVSNRSGGGGYIARLKVPEPEVAGAQAESEEIQQLRQLYELLVKLRDLLLLYEKIS